MTAATARARPGGAAAGWAVRRGGSTGIHHGAPRALPRRREGSPDRRTKAERDEGRASADGEFAGLGSRRGQTGPPPPPPAEGGKRWRVWGSPFPFLPALLCEPECVYLGVWSPAPGS